MKEPEHPASNLTPPPREAQAVAVAIKGATGDSGGKNKDLPTIIASGRGDVAGQILELAFARGIKVRQDADLAELLVKLDLDTPIPSEAIIAVAEILARVYQANARLANPAPLVVPPAPPRMPPQ